MDRLLQAAPCGEVPQLHDLIWRSAKKAGDAKKSMDPAVGDELLALIAEVAAIFQKTKAA